MVKRVDLPVLIPVICDRYAYSGAAFSAAKGLDLDWCKAGDVGLPKPDLVLYFDIEPEVAAQRGDYGKERYENVGFQTLVRENYLRLEDESWRVLDANTSVECLHEQVVVHVEALQKQMDASVVSSDVGELWK
jgi:dTMP kinase